MIVGWLVFVAAVLTSHGCNQIAFQLADSVLIALITTSTATVIGVFLVVTKYLFSKS